MAKTPNIRFKGFSEEWKEAPLSEYLMVSNERNNDNHYTAKDIQSVSGEYGVVNQIEFQGRSFAGASLLNYRVIYHGEIAYTKSPLKLSPYGIIKANKNVTGIVSALYGVYKVKQGDANFIQCYFDLRSRLNNYLRPLVNKGAKNTLLITDEDAIAGKVVFPKDLEQKEITTFIDKISSTILQREAELEKLKNIKRALLEKLFPQNGQKVPAIRFKGFDTSWDKCRLKDVAIRITRKNDGLVSTLPLCISAQLGLVSQTEYYNNTVVGANLANYFLVKKGEFAYNKSAAAEYPLGAVKCLEKHDMGILSTLYIVFALKQGVDSDYIKAHYDAKPWQEDVQKRIAVGARNHGLLNISPEDFFDSLVVKPNATEEQQKIGALFAKLSSLLYLRERQLILLKHTKQALLEQMFVNE